MTSIDQKVANRWVARVIPVFLVGIVGYATWVVVVLVCVDYLLKPASTVREPRRGAAIAIITIYTSLLLLLAITYFRLVHTVVTNPGYTPRGPQWHAQNAGKRRHSRSRPVKPGLRDLEKQNGAYNNSAAPPGESPPSRSANVPSAFGPADDIPMPSLQDFYMRDVFTCESDGRPIWCSTCLNWKLDRAHHCREVARCVRKMDHFCPWVGGIVSETSQKFFVQFVSWGAAYCLFNLIFMAKFVAERRHAGPNIHWIVVLALAALFSLFLMGMSGSSLQFVFQNTTTIENLSRRTKVWQLAIYMPNPPQGIDPPPFRTVTYGQPPSESSNPTPTVQPSNYRTFAILHSRPGENPWDLGPFRNFKSVMGDYWYDWILPIKRSPCARHDRLDCEFETGPVVERMKREAGIIPPLHTDTEEKPRRHRRRRRRRSTHPRSAESAAEENVAYSEKKKRRHRRH